MLTRLSCLLRWHHWEIWAGRYAGLEWIGEWCDRCGASRPYSYPSTPLLSTSIVEYS